jgi:thioesterase domain-containing protein
MKELEQLEVLVPVPEPVPVRDSGDLPPLLCLPPVSGSAYWSLPLARYLPQQQPIYAAECPGLAGGPVATTLPILAELFVRSLRSLAASGPYLLTGYSMGGLVAFEMARLLVAAGETVPVVVLIDSPPPAPRPPAANADLVRQFVVDVAGSLFQPVPPDLDALVDRVCAAADPDQAVYEAVCTAGLMPWAVGLDFVRHRYRLFHTNMQALRSYDPGPYDGRVAVLRAAEEPDRSAGWRHYVTGRYSEVTVPGDHYTLWSAEHRGAVSQALGRCLAAAL